MTSPVSTFCPFCVLQSRKYYFLSEEADEKEDLSQRCRDLEHQVGSSNVLFLQAFPEPLRGHTGLGFVYLPLV